MGKLKESIKEKKTPVSTEECEIINLTSTMVNILDENKEVVHIEPSHMFAFVGNRNKLTKKVNFGGHTINVYGTRFDDNVSNLPEYDPNSSKYYIVTNFVAVMAKSMGRPIDDLLVPNRLVKDESGKVIGANGLRVIED